MLRTTTVAFLQAVRADPLFEIVGYLPTAYQVGFDLLQPVRTKPGP